MRDILAALLRSRGYIHNDGADPGDLIWFSPSLGYKPLLACLAHEMTSERGMTQYEACTVAGAIERLAAPVPA